jgi:hypothetical protein
MKLKWATTMKASEFIFLIEKGLSHGDLAKRYGEYLDQLITFINNGEEVELEGASWKKYGNFVTFEKEDAKKLAQVYYGQDEIPTDKTNVEVTDAGPDRIVPVGNYKTLRLTIQGTKDTVPVGHVHKSDKFKSGKGFNAGDVGEAFLGAAATAKFRSPNVDITEEDIINVLKSMTITEAAKTLQGEVWTEVNLGPNNIPNSDADELYFKLVLNRSGFTAIQKAIKSGTWHPKMAGLNRSAVMWANTNQTVTNAVKTIIENGKKNMVKVTSDGTMDQKGTKADLFLTVDDITISLLSAKTGDVKQFGQVSGDTFEVFQEYFNKILGVDIPDTWIDQLEGVSRKESFEILQKIYEKVFTELKAELAGNTKKEVTFLDRLYSGIKHFATNNDPNVSMVILKTTPNAPGYKELFFGPELHEAMKQFDLKIDYQATPPVIKIFGVPVGSDAKEVFAGKEMLVQIRSNLKPSESYLRNTIEMGDLLKHIADVKYKIERDDPITQINPTKP